MEKTIFDTQQTCDHYDKTHVIGYINEDVDENYVPDTTGMETTETPQPRKVYKYDEVIIESPDFTRDNLVNGLIRSKYSATQEFAILRHHQLDADKYADEWTEFNEWVEKAKTEVERWLAE